ncbi:MAG: DUF5107 domain-containing protein [Anaerolineae bacterium]
MASATAAPTQAEQTPEPTVEATAVPTALPTATTAATIAPSPTPLPEPTTEPARITAWWDEIGINTYGYQAALFTDAALPYPRLNRSQVTLPEMRTYRLLHVANSVVELTFMPDLGGRLYQIRFLPTGQKLLYNNTVIKPTTWGPTEMGWWLAAGGIEWCLPVEEHGYLTAEPWETSVSMGSDGSATVTMQITEKTRNLHATVQVHLQPASSAILIRSTVYNPNAEPKSLQFWINALLTPGGHSVDNSLRFIMPTDKVLVHSTEDSGLPAPGSLMSWPIYNGRDLSYYSNWQRYLGFFGYNLSSPFTAVYDEQTQIGMVRSFPPEIARGTKFFGFGAEFGDVGLYTDDGSKYVEMWGGLTPSFWDLSEIPAGGSVTWDETWWVAAGGGTPVQANNNLALAAQRDGEGLLVGLMAAQAGDWTIRISTAEGSLVEQAVFTSPDNPFRARLALPAAAVGKTLYIEVYDSNHQLALYYQID